MNNPFKEADNYNDTCNKRAVEAQKEGDDTYKSFINKIILYSSGMLTTSITGFIALYNQINIKELQTIFILIALFSIASIIFGLTVTFLSSYAKFAEAVTHIADGKIHYEKTKLQYGPSIKDWDESHKTKTTENFNYYTDKREEIDKKHNIFNKLGRLSCFLSILFFLANCFTILTLLISIK